MDLKNVLITGGAGFIGGHLAHLLQGAGKNVRVLDNLSVGNRDNVPEGAQLIVGDILDPAMLEKAFTDIDIVFHLAAKVSIRLAVEEFQNDAEINLIGTLNVLKAARDASVKKIVYASSMAVYGDPDYSPQDENHPTRPTSPYGVSKLASEKYISILAPLWGIDFINLRLFNTYGARQTRSPYVGVITIFIGNILKNEKLMIFGDGKQRRDFIYVGDVARAFEMAGSASASGLSLNVGTGIPTDVNTIADILIEHLDKDVEPEHTPPVPGEPGDSIANTSLSQSTMGFTAEFQIEEKIDEAIEWNRSCVE